MDQHSLTLILVTLAAVALIDYVPRAFLLIKKPTKAPTSFGKIPTYLIMPTVYGNISYLQNLSFLKKYSDKVVICTSTHESRKFYNDLKNICEQYGFRYIRCKVPKVKGKLVKNAYTIYKGAFLGNKLGADRDTPCILIDADTYATQNVNNLARAFVKSKLDIASLRCEAANPQNIIETLQQFEYKLAMDNRRMDPWLTSGACNIAKARVLRHIFTYHSDFFAGGDIEIGKLAQVMGYRIHHINFTFYTAVPSTLKDWYKQRMIWFAGGVRHHVANMGSFGWHHFFLLFYNSLLIYLLFPLRWIELMNFPLTLAFLIVLSWLYTCIIILRKGWKPVYLLLPFYAFVQSMVILPLAFGRYVKLAWNQRSLGLLKYDLSHNSRSARVLFRTLNVSSASFVLFAAYAFTNYRIDYWLHNGSVMKVIFH